MSEIQSNEEILSCSFLAGRLQWYALHTKSNFEKITASEVSAKGLESFLPVRAELHRWKDRKKTIETPLFPGYVFVRIADCDRSRLQVVRSTGAVRILGTGTWIEPIPDVEIDSIRTLIRSGIPFHAHSFLREGERVRVKWGPLEGVEGVLTRIKSENRLIMSVEMLSQSVAVQVDLDHVEAVRAMKGRAPIT